MLRSFIRNRIKREEGESKVDFILRRQEEVEDAMERIDVAATIAALTLTCTIIIGAGIYLFIQAFSQPVGHYIPIRDDNGITVGWQWVAPEER